MTPMTIVMAGILANRNKKYFSLLFLYKKNCAIDGSESEKPKQEGDGKGVHTVATSVESLTINEDVKENESEDEDNLPIYQYERLKTTAVDPVTEIDVTRREVISRSHITFLFQKNVMVTLFSIWCADLLIFD